MEKPAEKDQSSEHSQQNGGRRQEQRQRHYRKASQHQAVLYHRGQIRCQKAAAVSVSDNNTDNYSMHQIS